ncbi:hypothetical protein DCCM_4485 [Desulfocucumis palustris]|uniref:Uncharacterized protein n=1 Tax=Desulfocucumis palustris TaxID=1898651 RepID=A0A2L2XGU7_9FIRM|nr:hypothetical protein DCCM_4485 [Desulfocucumis palustris]
MPGKPHLSPIYIYSNVNYSTKKIISSSPSRESFLVAASVTAFRGITSVKSVSSGRAFEDGVLGAVYLN